MLKALVLSLFSFIFVVNSRAETIVVNVTSPEIQDRTLNIGSIYLVDIDKVTVHHKPENKATRAKILLSPGNYFSPSPAASYIWASSVEIHVPTFSIREKWEKALFDANNPLPKTKKYTSPCGK